MLKDSLLEKPGKKLSGLNTKLEKLLSRKRELEQETTSNNEKILKQIESEILSVRRSIKLFEARKDRLP